MDQYVFELDGVEFGYARPVKIEPDGFDPGTLAPLTQDADNPLISGVLFGQDRVQPPTWQWSLFADRSTSADALAAAARLHGVWVRERDPGEVSVLRYQLGGRIRRVYGRPGKCAMAVDYRRFRSGFAGIDVEFRRASPLHFNDLERAIAVPMVGGGGGGLILPAAAPFVFGAAQLRSGLITDVGGDRPAPFRVDVTGPLAAGAIVAGAGWQLVTSRALRWDETLTVSTYPWDVQVTVNGAASAALGPASTQLSKARLDPAGDEVTFQGYDPTGTAQVLVRWRPAWVSL